MLDKLNFEVLRCAWNPSKFPSGTRDGVIADILIEPERTVATNGAFLATVERPVRGEHEPCVLEAESAKNLLRRLKAHQKGSKEPVFVETSISIDDLVALKINKEPKRPGYVATTDHKYPDWRKCLPDRRRKQVVLDIDMLGRLMALAKLDGAVSVVIEIEDESPNKHPVLVSPYVGGRVPRVWGMQMPRKEEIVLKRAEDLE